MANKEPTAAANDNNRGNDQEAIQRAVSGAVMRDAFARTRSPRNDDPPRAILPAHRYVRDVLEQQPAYHIRLGICNARGRSQRCSTASSNASKLRTEKTAKELREELVDTIDEVLGLVGDDFGY